MSTVLLGNAAPLMKNGDAADHLNQTVTRVELWDGIDDSEFVELSLSTDNDPKLAVVGMRTPADERRYAVALHELAELWPRHSSSPPAWIASDDPALERAAARYFNCPAGEPTMLLTNGGRDAIHAQYIGTSTQPAQFNYGALTANTGVASASDTTLTGEITTASGGLVRAAMTYAHTTGTNTSTLTKTWTANASDSLPVDIWKWANFNDPTAGTMGDEIKFVSAASLTAIGDSVTITFTLTLG